MLIIESYSLAVALTIVCMICWGSWSNTQVFVSNKNYRFELFYWDFIFGILIFSLVAAFTVGSSGEGGRSFLNDVSQAETTSIGSAILGGAIWNLGTLLLVAGIAVAGMSVAFPIGGGIGWIFGIIVNYIGQPVGNPLWLFSGVAAIAVAILLNMQSYRKLSSETAKPTTKGILLSFSAGLLIAFFYRFVAESMITDFTNPEAGLLTPYSAAVFFAVGALISTIAFNPIFMRYPVQGERVSMSSFFKASGSTHLAGIAGGLIFGLGTMLSFIASGEAGFAISYGLSNSAPIVAAFWGIFIWKEFKAAPKGTNNLLTFMFVFYLIGLALIIYSRFA